MSSVSCVVCDRQLRDKLQWLAVWTSFNYSFVYSFIFDWLLGGAATAEGDRGHHLHVCPGVGRSCVKCDVQFVSKKTPPLAPSIG